MKTIIFLKSKTLFVVVAIGLMASVSGAYAYGSGGSSKTTCKKPGFSEFNPPHLAKVSPQSEFSLLVTGKVQPGSIHVTVKKQAVDVDVKKQGSKILVTGKLPDSLQKTYARINVSAKTTQNCKGSDGWLVQVE